MVSESLLSNKDREAKKAAKKHKESLTLHDKSLAQGRPSPSPAPRRLSVLEPAYISPTPVIEVTPSETGLARRRRYGTTVPYSIPDRLLKVPDLMIQQPIHTDVKRRSISVADNSNISIIKLKKRRSSVAPSFLVDHPGPQIELWECPIEPRRIEGWPIEPQDSGLK